MIVTPKLKISDITDTFFPCINSGGIYFLHDINDTVSVTFSLATTKYTIFLKLMKQHPLLTLFPQLNQVRHSYDFHCRLLTIQNLRFLVSCDYQVIYWLALDPGGGSDAPTHGEDNINLHRSLLLFCNVCASHSP
jgi:hypothetical protein